MDMEKLFAEALGISSPWYIKSVNFNSKQNKLDIEVDFKKGSVFQDSDEDSTKDNKAKEYKAYDTVKKTWKHLNFFEHECYIHARTPRIKRDDEKSKIDISSLVRNNARFYITV